MDGPTARAPDKPLSLLICAMGGEGGGVLTTWIVAAARASGLAAQATSVPGVAQRTGGTTYYVEMARRDSQGRAPVLALTPVAGQIDVVLASELLEAARAARLGQMTPDRTELIASTHRVFLIQEKMAMSDGRLDPAALEAAARSRSRRATFLDMEKLATEAGVPISPVMLGALAGSGAMPIDKAAFEAAIRAGGIAVERNLAAFRTAFERVAGTTLADATRSAPAAAADPAGRSASDFIIPPAGPVVGDLDEFAIEARDVIAHGIVRLRDYQDESYAALYRQRLTHFRNCDGRLQREVARHLALRMSYEDVIRVAQHKARTTRYERIRGELGVAADEPFEVQDFFKPGVREMADVLPPRLARWLLARAERSAWLGNAHLGMRLRTTTITGYARVWLLARLRPWRRGTHRYRAEQAAIETWLALVLKAATRGDTALALEIAELARLIKGYGDTHRRGSANYDAIVARLIVPELAGPGEAGGGAARIRAAREAALADPEGKEVAAALTARTDAVRPVGAASRL